jgi:hypothetical protein
MCHDHDDEAKGNISACRTGVGRFDRSDYSDDAGLRNLDLEYAVGRVARDGWITKPANGENTMKARKQFTLRFRDIVKVTEITLVVVVGSTIGCSIWLLNGTVHYVA